MSGTPEEVKKGHAIRIKALAEASVAGVIAVTFCYSTLITPATLAALAIRRKMPEAWFSGLITYYAAFAVAVVATLVAGVACRMVYKHAMSASPER